MARWPDAVQTNCCARPDGPGWLRDQDRTSRTSRAWKSHAGYGRRGALTGHSRTSRRAGMYVLPTGDFALGLSVGQDFSRGELATARKLGVIGAELQKLETAILNALQNGPLLPDEIWEVVRSASRNFGPEGKRKGLTTTLPVSLGSLQASGQIRRLPVNGRLDQQRYRYVIWHPNPLQGFTAFPTARIRNSLGTSFAGLYLPHWPNFVGLWTGSKGCTSSHRTLECGARRSRLRPLDAG